MALDESGDGTDREQSNKEKEKRKDVLRCKDSVTNFLQPDAVTGVIKHRQARAALSEAQVQHEQLRDIVEKSLQRRGLDPELLKVWSDLWEQEMRRFQTWYFDQDEAIRTACVAAQGQEAQAANAKTKTKFAKQYTTERTAIENDIASYVARLPEERELSILVYTELKEPYADLKQRIEVTLKNISNKICNLHYTQTTSD